MWRIDFANECAIVGTGWWTKKWRTCLEHFYRINTIICHWLWDPWSYSSMISWDTTIEKRLVVLASISWIAWWPSGEIIALISTRGVFNRSSVVCAYQHILVTISTTLCSMNTMDMEFKKDPWKITSWRVFDFRWWTEFCVTETRVLL